MKAALNLFILMILMSCDPYQFGFKNNPAYVLDETLKAIQNQDLDSVTEVMSKEALCVYANVDGLKYLKEHVSINSTDVKLSWKLRESHLSIPENNGFWSYFSSRYLIDVQSKANKLLAQVVVDCDYGTDGYKDDKLINLNPKKYLVKECRLVKIIPQTFEALPLTDPCQAVAVDITKEEFKATVSSDSRELLQGEAERF